VITLSSDFGSPYPAAMKGVLLRQTDARLVDVAHDFPRQDVRAAGFWLREILPEFPPAVHLVVVDPGVGTDRDAVVVRAGGHALVGPDNGVLLPAARELGDPEAFVLDAGADARSDEAAPAWARPASATFHGRDVFAPAAAAVHEAGVDALNSVTGVVPAADLVELTFPSPTVEADRAVGEVLAVDGFGNAITNIPGGTLTEHFGSHAQVNGVTAPIRRTYAEVDPGDRLITVGSHGNVELAVNRGRGDEAFGVDAGSRVRLVW
jgi:S-adenosylmethionine hydrolase